MALHTTSTPTCSDRNFSLESLLKDLEAETPAVGALNDAIRRGDQGAVRDICSSMEPKAIPIPAPMRLAIVLGHPELLKILLERDSDVYESVVEVACERKDRECIRILLAYGWPINKRLGLDMSILDFAVEDLGFMQFLVQLGADVNARSRLDESPLSVAIGRGSMDVVRFLIDNGTDLAHGDLLHCAAKRSNPFEGAELVDELAARGVPVCTYQYDNPVAFRFRGLHRVPTPLHIACENGNILVAVALIRHGADPHQLMLEAGKFTEPSPMDIAHQREDRTLIDVLTGTFGSR